MGRTIAIWVFGLLASAIVGAVGGSQLNMPDGGFWGLLAAMFAFACLRLWLSSSKKTN